MINDSYSLRGIIFIHAYQRFRFGKLEYVKAHYRKLPIKRFPFKLSA